MHCLSCSAAIVAEARFCSSCGASVAIAGATQSDPLRDLLQSALSPTIEIVRPLGRGGMGTVYLGRETALDREVAIKTLHLETAGASELRERFRREARIAARLNHPHIVPLYTFGESRDVIYYVMGFVRGESLADRLARETTGAPEDARRTLLELADALSYAHERGIVHRDIKPENVLIEDTTGKAILTDFGIARVSGGTNLTEAGRLVGTPHYMSPEQARGGEVGPASDIYSLGVLAYRMITGGLPVRGDSLPALIAQLASEKGPAIAPLPPEVPAFLGDAVMRCLRRDPSERWTAAALRDALKTESDAWELPEEMRPFEGRAFYVLPVVALAFMFIAFELFLWDFVEPSWRMAILLFQFGAAIATGLLGVGVAEGRKLGLPTSVITNVLLRHPRWYFGWVPRWARRPGDFWARLPLPFRLFRIATTISYALVVLLFVVLPFAILGIQANLNGALWIRAFACFVATVMLFLIATAVHANIYMAKRGLTPEERSRVLQTPPLPKSVWSEPKLAGLLLPEADTRAEGDSTSPSKLVERIVSRVRLLPAPIAKAVLAAERDLAEAIAAIDAETTRIEALLDPGDVEHVERRLSALGASATAEESEVRRLLLEQQRVFRDLAARRDALSRQRAAWMARLRALDVAIASPHEPSQAAEIERQVSAIHDALARDTEETAVRQATTAMKSP